MFVEAHFSQKFLFGASSSLKRFETNFFVSLIPLSIVFPIELASLFEVS